MFREMTSEEMRMTDGGSQPVVIIPVVKYIAIRVAVAKAVGAAASILNK